MLDYEVKVSVLIPVYNAELFIRRCIDSVLNQTYQNFEAVLVDDGSTDNSRNICDEYAAQDSRVRVIYQENSGVSATRNVALENAKGSYILFVDSDDYIEPNMIEVLVEDVNKNDCDIAMCGYYIQHGNNLVKAGMKYQAIYNTNEEVVNGLLRRFYTGDNTGLNCLWNKLIRRDMYLKHNISFNTNLKRAEDMWFVFDCLKHTDRLSFIDTPFYHYVQNVSSVMHQIYSDQYQQWKYTRKRLLDENQEFRFQLDMPTFYSNFLLNSMVYAKYFYGKGQKEIALDMFCDDLFLDALQYAGKTKLRPHIKLLLWMLYCKKYPLVFMGLNAWNRISG